MKALKSIPTKTNKHDRERQVLLGLVEYYLKTGKPVGSNTLKEMGFENLSSATIRNYFAHLEEDGYLHQQHTSGGRIPTDKAYKLFAAECLSTPIEVPKAFEELRNSETREITSFLQHGAESLAEQTKTAVFLSAPRFEQDFIISIKVVVIDDTRCLCVMVTDFGQVLTEILNIGHKLSSFSSKRIETYFHWRLTGQDKPSTISKEEEELAQRLYNELMVRYIVSYSHFDSEIYRTGFSSLLSYPEFHDTELLANSLGLFENTHGMRLLLKECGKFNTLKFWIGDDLAIYSPQPNPACTVIAIPYYVNKQPVGAVGLLGPMRLPYQNAFAVLRQFSESVSEALTHNLYKFKITLRQPKQEVIDIKQKELKLIGQSPRLQLEDKRASVKPPSRRK